MIKKAIKNIDLFTIVDEIAQKTYYGGHQGWYPTEWQRRSGCGPTVVAIILYYLQQRCACSPADKAPLSKGDCLNLMEEVWQYVTPGERGIPSTGMLRERVLRYAQAKGLEIFMNFMDIPETRDHRPVFPLLLDFLDKALCNDTPVAFLNLHSGAEEQLDSWHWVTILSLEFTEDSSTAVVHIADQGAILRVNLLNWFKTTTLGGGFVSFSIRQPEDPKQT